MIYKILAILFLGGIFGFFISTLIINKKKAKEKKNIYKLIDKQEQQLFMIPRRKEAGELEQQKVNLKEYVGLIKNEEEKMEKN